MLVKFPKLPSFNLPVYSTKILDVNDLQVSIITPTELLGEMTNKESWPMHWLEDSMGKNRECGFPMVGNATLGRQLHVMLSREDEAIVRLHMIRALQSSKEERSSSVMIDGHPGMDVRRS
jgi:hypothetical protein